jgi:hypothetical protein
MRLRLIESRYAEARECRRNEREREREREGEKSDEILSRVFALSQKRPGGVTCSRINEPARIALYLADEVFYPSDPRRERNPRQKSAAGRTKGIAIPVDSRIPSPRKKRDRGRRKRRRRAGLGRREEEEDKTRRRKQLAERKRASGVALNGVSALGQPDASRTDVSSGIIQFMKPRGRSTVRARARMRAFYFVGANGQETARAECSWNWIKHSV